VATSAAPSETRDEIERYIVLDALAGILTLVLE
jgi:hypothetical protein